MKTPTISTTSKRFPVQKNVSGIFWERIHPLLLPKVLLYESYRYLFRHLYIYIYPKEIYKNNYAKFQEPQKLLELTKNAHHQMVSRKTTSKKLKASTSRRLKKNSKFFSFTKN